MFQLILLSSKKFLKKMTQEDESLNHMTIITALSKITEHYSSQQTKKSPKT